MTTSPVGGAAQSSLSQLYAAGQAQAAQAASAISTDPSADTSAFSSAAAASSSNSLTGTASSTLDSQTLGALLDMIQQDPTATASSGSQTAQAGQPAQAQGSHHHHHHHGGGGMTPPTDPSSAAASSAAASPAAAGTSTVNPFADATTDAQDVDTSLESALLTV